MIRYLFPVCLCALIMTSCGEELTPTENPEIITDTASTDRQLGFSDYRSGDLIFQEIASAEGRDIELATGSKHTNVGMIHINIDGDAIVIDASRTVQSTPIDKWIRMSKEGHYVVKRHNNSDELFSQRNIKYMATVLRGHRGKLYDPYYHWSNDLFYSAELIWKLFKDGTGVELAPLQTLGDFDLTSPEISAKMAEAYGDSIPFDEPAMSPEAIFNSEYLFTVHEN